MKALRQIADNEAGKDIVINRTDAEECCDAGWADSLPGVGYRLTEEGRQLLSETSGKREQ